jgi:rare lipoprotein A
MPVSIGHASWYGPGFAGKRTASGEVFDDAKLTAAHKSLPLGTKVKVTNLENGRSVRVEINDRGPFVGNRLIDLSRAAAHALGMVENGVVRVRIEYDDDPETRS